ncbi:MAG: SBBP repeat-containing protein [candidate division Zixibacteria bacterium]|nr:SBBP repeat-containing protein [candidate division Zixibacteria bacterium]
MKTLFVVLCAVIALVLCINIQAQLALGKTMDKQKIMANFSSMPLAFTENRGQWGEKTLFKAEAGGAAFYFCKDEVAYLFTRNTNEIDQCAMDHRENMPGFPDEMRKPIYKKDALLIKAQFVGANPNPEMIGEDRLAHNCNYFYSNNPTKWRTDVAIYSTIIYKDIYPNIDLRYRGNGHGIKYDFIVNPGADLYQIQICYRGVENLSVTNTGDLCAQTSFGTIYEAIPEIYQEKNGTKVSISGRYSLIKPGIFGFIVDNFDPSFTLIIDPEILYSTYLGGSGDDLGWSIAVDNAGCAYVIGQTASTDFPTQNSYQPNQGGTGNYDAFITKLSANGKSLIYSTYLGGSGNEYGRRIAVDGDGLAYVTGYTASSDFPTKNPYDGSFNGGYSDAFVTKLSANGDSLIYSTYLGGNDDDDGLGIAVDNAGYAYVAGQTNSTNFPTLTPYQGNQHGSDVFVTKLSLDGNSLIYSSYLGGTGSDAAYGIAIDGSGCAYVTGITEAADFPIQNAFQTNQFGYDAFVTKFSDEGDSLLYSTYIGGSDFDYGNDIAVDIAGCAYVTGVTSSTDFPLQNPYQTSQAGSGAFVTKLSAAGNAAVYSTYLGGDDYDEGYGICVDSYGCAYLSGRTHSVNFPTQNPLQPYQQYIDIFVTKFSPDGNSLVFSSYLGGSADEFGYDIAVDGFGSIYVTGFTASTDFPTYNAYDSSYNTHRDAIVTKINAAAMGIDDPGPTLPQTYQLLQNYPNPFNPVTTIDYSLARRAQVTIDIFNIRGQKVRTLVNETKSAGSYRIDWDGNNDTGDPVSTGIYLYRFKAGDVSQTKKMLLMK